MSGVGSSGAKVVVFPRSRIRVRLTWWRRALLWLRSHDVQMRTR